MLKLDHADMRNRLRRITAFGCSALFLFAAGRCIWIGVAADRGMPAGAPILVITLGLSYGLFKQYNWAIWTTIVIFLLCALILSVGLFNPFTAGDYLSAGKVPPTIGKTLLWLVPLEVLLLSAICILDPRKNEKV